MKALYSALVLALGVTSVYSQNLEFGGYLNAKMQVIDYNDSVFISHTETFRLEANRTIGENGALEAHLLFSSPFEPINPAASFKEGSFMRNTYDEMMAGTISGLGLPDSINAQSILDNPMVTDLYYSSMVPKDVFALDRAVLKLYFKHADLFVGKQVISWGTGYAWNPTDFWNLKNPTDPEAAKSGTTALRTEIPLGDLSSLDLVVAPGLRFDEGSAGMRLKSNVFGYDFSVMSARQMNPDRALYGLPPKWISGFDVAGDLFDGIGFWMEGAIINRIFSGQDMLSLDSSYANFDIGINYTFDNELMIMAEYYYNGLGKESSSEYTAGDFSNMFAGEMTGLGQSYALLSLNRGFLDFFKGSMNAIMNINDQSITLVPSIAYSWNDDMDISIGSNVFIGDLDSEFGSLKQVAYGEVKGYF